jgi:hypothetical protein
MKISGLSLALDKSGKETTDLEDNLPLEVVFKQ